MDSIFEHYKKTGYLHHAHVVVGEHEVFAPKLVEAVEKYFHIEAKGNPDLSIRQYEALGIDEARDIKTEQSRAGFGTAHKFFIVSARSLTTEAQNALLKTFEEPTDGTHFFLIVPRVEILLPTLRSRVVVVQDESIGNENDEAKVLAEKFLDVSLEGRFAQIKKLTEKKAGEVVDRELFRAMLDHVERLLYARTEGSPDTKAANVFREIFQAKTYLADRGSSPKMLLEHVAIVVSR